MGEKEFKVIAACLVQEGQEGGMCELGQKPNNWGKKKKKSKNVSCSDVIRKAKAEL